MADLLCTSCGEPWDFDYVLHEAQPNEFTRNGGLITHCPSCSSHQTPIMERGDLEAAAEIAVLMGDDVDATAAFLQDFGLTR